jgi:U6 snRNA-associated Sm-like protein LSm4
LLTAAKNQPIMVELKNGETLNGQLINCDQWMNLTLRDVIQSSANAEEFMTIPECYVRGLHIKYLRMPDELMDHAKEQTLANLEQRNRNQKRRGGGGGGGGGGFGHSHNGSRRGHGDRGDRRGGHGGARRGSSAPQGRF